MAVLPGVRVRNNGIVGITTDNPLTAGATTFSSANLAQLGVVIGNHAIITLDPMRQYGNPEIVMVTTHTAASTVATIQRGMYGTTPRTHPAGTLWVHAAVTDDFISIVTSVTRPTDSFKGQLIYENDTASYKSYNGVAWVDINPDSGWQTLSLVNGWISYDNIYGPPQFRKIGGIVYIQGLAKSGTTTNGTVIATLPAGYRPASGKKLRFVTTSNETFAQVDVGGDGNIYIATGASALWFSLNLPGFPAEG